MIIEFDIPEVLDPKNPFLGYWGAQMFIGHFSDSPRVISLSTTFVRCTFSALEDYREAAKQLHEYYSSSEKIKISSVYRAIARFESCISYLHLGIQTFNVLRNRNELEGVVRDAIFRAKPAFRAGPVCSLVRHVRDDMQHIEERLVKGLPSNELTYFIQPTGIEVPVHDPANPGQTKLTIDRFKILEHEIKFRDIANWLGGMVDYVQILADLMPRSVSSS